MSLLSDITIARLCGAELDPKILEVCEQEVPSFSGYNKLINALNGPTMGKHPMIEPFVPHQVRADAEGKRIISYGLTSYGYDVRCGRQFKIFTNHPGKDDIVVDPKNFDEASFVHHEGDYCIIPPNSFALAHTLEYFYIPRNSLAICVGKSTYARCGIVVNCTPFEPEWHGQVTLEFSNTTPLPVKIYAGEGCAQVLFAEGDQSCAVSYADRGGKYQGQTGVTIPRT